MSGRPYARNPNGQLGGATDLDAILPHRFRIAAPRQVSKIKELAIRRAIRRRCMEKNWKKLITLRHKRMQDPEEVSSEPGEESRSERTPAVDLKAESWQSTHENGSSSNTVNGSILSEKSVGGNVKSKDDVVTNAKKQLEELEKKLKVLSEQKHAKFLQLKEILVEEARSKTSAPTSATSNSVNSNKKRRVEFADQPMPTPRSGGSSTAITGSSSIIADTAERNDGTGCVSSSQDES